MIRALTAKLQQFSALSDADRRALRDAVSDVRDLAAGDDIIREGEQPESVHLLIEGWAVRYKDLPSGERQNLAFLIPGDLCDVHITLLDQMDHSIGALSAAKVAFIPKAKMDAILARGDELSRALWWATLVDEAILREWLVSLGRRTADERLAHLICEMVLRAKAVGLTHDESFEMPLTQVQLADTLGLSAVHMNRTLKALRSDQLMSMSGKRVIVHDLPRLMRLANFDPKYLHQGRDPRRRPLPDRGSKPAATAPVSDSARP